jgi:hypothetical protein
MKVPVLRDRDINRCNYSVVYSNSKIHFRDIGTAVKLCLKLKRRVAWLPAAGPDLKGRHPALPGLEIYSPIKSLFIIFHKPPFVRIKIS